MVAARSYSALEQDTEGRSQAARWVCGRIRREAGLQVVHEPRSPPGRGLAPGVALAPGALNGAGASNQLRATRGRCATGPLANQQVRSVYQLAVTDERLTLQALRVAARHLALNACGLMLGAVLVRI
jgi:hypothetical protein